MLDKERFLLFSLNALDEFQDKMGGYGEFEKVLSDLNLLGWLLALLLNEGSDEGEKPLTEAEAGGLIRPENINEIRICILKALVKGMIGDDEPENAEDDRDGEHGSGAGKIDIARLLYIGTSILNFPEREVWKMTAYKLMTLFKIHRSFHLETFGGTKYPRGGNPDYEDDIDCALGGL